MGSYSHEELSTVWTSHREGLWSPLLTEYYSCDHNKKNEIGRACSTYGGQERCVQGFGGETCRKETTWKT